MSAIGTGYDLSASQFSPDGRVFQVEYAQKAVENSGTVVALRGKDCVVIAVEKLVQSKLFEEGVNKRIFNIDKHIGCGVIGLIADARSVVEQARQIAQEYTSDYGCPVPITYLKDRIAQYLHAYTLYSALRPFGTSLVLANYNKHDGPQLYNVDPSGLAMGYYSVAVGKGRQAAKAAMENKKIADMTSRELVKEAARVIYVVHDEVKDKAFELELSWVGDCTNGIHEPVPSNIFKEAEAYAKESIREDTSSDEEMVARV
ncbi:Proteasome subunit alpha type-3, partial [Fragariocoptes setiger]